MRSCRWAAMVRLSTSATKRFCPWNRAGRRRLHILGEASPARERNARPTGRATGPTRVTHIAHADRALVDSDCTNTSAPSDSSITSARRAAARIVRKCRTTQEERVHVPTCPLALSKRAPLSYLPLGAAFPPLDLDSFFFSLFSRLCRPRIVLAFSSSGLYGRSSSSSSLSSSES